MNQLWTLHVEELARIKSADIEINSLMCFVGENNSGKSYLMSLLWGILTLGKDYFPKKPSEGKVYKQCESWLKAVLDGENDSIEVNSSIFVSWFSEVINLNKKALVKRLFHFDVVIGKIEIKNYRRKKPLFIRRDENRERYSTQKDVIIFPKKTNYTRDELLKMNEYICWYLLMGDLSAPLFTQPVRGRRNGEPVYLPASRTGFMLTFPQLVDSSLQASYSSEESDVISPLTLPYVDFLQLITKFEVVNTKNKYDELIRFMEGQMTGGNLTVRKQMLPEIKYRPKGTSTELPLYVSSSIVSETAPLLLLLKTNIKFNTLIIEEPEAHLHPELQQQMARMIIRIVNSGIPVWITTHSDTVIQHLNNMIKLKGNPNCKELMDMFSYDENDLISSDSICMYQFEKKGNSSTIERLKCEKYGFVVNTFNNSLKSIMDEVYAFQDGD